MARWSQAPPQPHAASPAPASAGPASPALAGPVSPTPLNGPDDMLLTSAGLWTASDNFGGNTSCGGNSGHAGICFLPCS